MSVLLFLKKVFMYFCPFALLVAQIMVTFEKEEVSDKLVGNRKVKGNWIDIVEALAALTLFCIFMLFILPRYKDALWCKITSSMVFVFFIFLTFSNACVSSWTIKEMIKSKEKKDISVVELSALGGMMFVIFVLSMQNIPEAIIAKCMTISNGVISDWAYIITFSAFTFIYFFFIFSVLPLPLASFSKWIIKIGKRSKGKVRKHILSDFYAKLINGMSISSQHFLKRTYCKSVDKPLPYQVLIAVISPCLFILDIIVLILMTIKSMLCMMLGVVFLLMRHVVHSLTKAIKWISTLSDKRVNAMSFRVATIVTLTLLVGINRYQPLGWKSEQTTAVLEFIASAILIPILFSWISEYKSATKTNTGS